MADDVVTPEEEQVIEDDLPENIKELKRKLDKLLENNMAMEHDLRHQGVQLNAAAIMQMRLDLLLSLILSPEDRFDFEVRSAENLRDMLMQTQAEVARARLAGGGPGAGSGLLIPQPGAVPK